MTLRHLLRDIGRLIAHNFTVHTTPRKGVIDVNRERMRKYVGEYLLKEIYAHTYLDEDIFSPDYFDRFTLSLDFVRMKHEISNLYTGTDFLSFINRWSRKLAVREAKKAGMYPTRTPLAHTPAGVQFLTDERYDRFLSARLNQLVAMISTWEANDKVPYTFRSKVKHG